MRNKGNIIYREIQQFNQVWILIIVAFMLLTYLIIYEFIFRGLQMELLLLTLIFPMFLYVIRMVIEVRNDGLYVRLIPFHFSFHKIPLENLRQYQIRSFSPIKDYGGWGIRYGPNSKAYIIRGNVGVQLEFFSGETILIGSSNPEKLAKAVDSVSRKE